MFRNLPGFASKSGQRCNQVRSLLQSSPAVVAIKSEHDSTRTLFFVRMPNRTEHSNEKRALVIQFVIEEGKSQAETSRQLKIPRSTVSDIIRAYYCDGRIIKSKTGGSRNVLLTEDLKTMLLQLIHDDCTITLQSMIEKLNLSVNRSTVWRWLKILNISFKMTRQVPKSRNCQGVKVERERYANWYTSLPLNVRYRNLVFIDESPFSLHLLRSHGRSIVGTTPNPVVQNSRGRNVTMIVAVNALNIIHCEAIMENVNHPIFQNFLQKLEVILGDEDFVIVMDNVRFHHTNQDFYDSYPYEIHYLPRYSPFLNPCEEVFSQIKSNVRKDGPILGSNDLLERMESASLSVTESHLKNYFQHSEEFLGRCHTFQDIGRE